MPSLFDEQFRKQIAAYIESNSGRITINTALFTILEGNLFPTLTAKLQKDLGKKSFDAAKERIASINYYRKVIDKLSTIYQTGVVRQVVNGTESDQELVDWYVEKLDMNPKMNSNNENYNAYQYSLLYFTLTDPNSVTQQRSPFIRSIPNHEFLVMSYSNYDPTSADVIIISVDPTYDPKTGKPVKTYHVYTETEFIVMDSSGNIITSEMDRLGQDGENPFNTYPFVYANNSENLVMPLTQDDDLQMALLIPSLLTDNNYSNKFQSFSMFVGIDVMDGEIDLAPNAWVNLKSDPESDKTPSFNTIKPTVDSEKTLMSASSQISLWLSSKGLRPGTVGSLDGDAFASGISKIIDESDTYENRKKQIETYKVVERDFWDKILKVYHPVWVGMGLLDNTTIFSSEAYVRTIFQEPKPLQSRMELLEELRAEIEGGFITRKAAMKKLNPDASDEEIEEMLIAIDLEKVEGTIRSLENATEQDGDTDNTESS